MSKNEKLNKLRNQEFDTKELIGLVDENELKKIAGAGVDVPPEFTPVIANMTKNLCSTTPCTTRCL
ncbi:MULTISPECIES: class II lanthipeptide, LchA2/BrtA2 family [unclassified Bacillus (in: firmicutes)]|uniref:class II lanthipeptide, LchA2/BrtA2 family n=1 Tax=unclassified Bacillus (in: firmicutes) TaxID=185979 RepID=UPI003835A608